MPLSADTVNRARYAFKLDSAGNEVTDQINANTAIVAFSGDATVTAGGVVSLAATSANVPLSTSPTKGVGYATGAGGTVTQATNKSTGVTLNTAVGEVVMNNANLTATTSVAFTLTNSVITANDVVVVCFKSVNTASSYTVMVDAVAAGSCSISLRNYTAGGLAEAIKIGFAVIKGVIA